MLFVEHSTGFSIPGNGSMTTVPGHYNIHSSFEGIRNQIFSLFCFQVEPKVFPEPGLTSQVSCLIPIHNSLSFVYSHQIFISGVALHYGILKINRNLNILIEKLFYCVALFHCSVVSLKLCYWPRNLLIIDLLPQE